MIIESPLYSTTILFDLDLLSRHVDITFLFSRCHAW